MQNRAKIFMPFDSLKGLKEAIKRTERLHENKFVEEETTVDQIKKINIFWKYRENRGAG